MSLSDEERRAWGELERSLAGEFPGAPDSSRQEDPWVPAIPPAARRTFVNELILIIGVAVLLLGALTLVPLVWITGIVVLCVGANRLDPCARDPRSFNPEESHRA